jgi:hypothetical protein
MRYGEALTFRRIRISPRARRTVIAAIARMIRGRFIPESEINETG